MGPTHQALVTGSFVWAIIGAVMALSSLAQVNPDARWLVGVASVAFPAAAAFAALALRRGAVRPAAFLLLLSVGTPTYFAWPLNVPALVAGLGLILAPSTFGKERRPQHA